MRTARTIPIYVGVLAVQLIGYQILRDVFAVEGSTASILTGTIAWSACVFIVGDRIGRTKLTLKDYSDLHGLSGAVLVVPAFEVLSMVLRLPSGPDLLVMGLAFFPVMALQTLTRRILFSPEEQDSLKAERTRLRHARRG